MGFMHGLAVVLIIFEGNIIKCKGTAPGDTISTNWIQDAPIIEIKGDQPLLPDDLMEVIVSRTDFETIQTTIKSRIIKATNTVMSTILQDRTIVIYPHRWYGTTHEYFQRGELVLRFGSYRGLVSFFDKFGDQVKKIKIFYDAAGSHVQPTQINQNIINRCVNNLEELRITTLDDGGVWEEILLGDNVTIFPKVKKFHCYGDSSRRELNLNLIFPKLESFKLFGSVTDTNCLANVTTLKELKLSSESIQEHQLDHIFANNKNMTRIFLQAPMKAETMHAIAKDLTKLETLEVENPDGHFLFRSNNRELYNLTSVTNFHITVSEMNKLIGDLSFDMPHLKKLRLDGTLMDNEIIYFVNHFKKLETVELLVEDYDPVECIQHLKHIKEFMVTSFENSELNSLRNMFKHFDETSKLETLKLVDFEDFDDSDDSDDSYQSYEDSMNKINIVLARSKKPTWTLTQGERTRSHGNCLMFKRKL